VIQSPRDIRSITNGSELMKEFSDLEEQIIDDIAPLREFLAKQVATNDVPMLHTHMSYIESWRDRVAWRLLLVEAFHEHGKCSHFMMAKPVMSNGGRSSVTDADREAHQKKFTGSMKAMEHYLTNLIDAVDSRVNQCKKLLGIEADVGGRRKM
jgi:hypothetical protein